MNGNIKCDHIICVNKEARLVCFYCKKRFPINKAIIFLKHKYGDKYGEKWLKLEDNIATLKEEKMIEKYSLNGRIIVYRL